MLSNFRSYLKSSSPFTIEKKESKDEDEAWLPASSDLCSASMPDLAEPMATPPKPPPPPQQQAKRKIAVISSTQAADLEQVFGKPTSHQQDLFVVDQGTVRLVSVPKRPPRPVSLPKNDPTVFYIRPSAQPLFVSQNSQDASPLPKPRPRSFELEEQRRQRVIAATLERMRQVSVASVDTTLLATPPKRPNRLPPSSRASNSPPKDSYLYVSEKQNSPLPVVNNKPNRPKSMRQEFNVEIDPKQQRKQQHTSLPTFKPPQLAKTPIVSNAPVVDINKAPPQLQPQRSTLFTSPTKPASKLRMAQQPQQKDDEDEVLSDFSDGELPTTTKQEVSPAFESLHHAPSPSPVPFKQQQQQPPQRQSSPPPVIIPKRLPPQQASPPQQQQATRPLSPPVMPPPRPPPEPPAAPVNKRSESEQRLANKCTDLLASGKIPELLTCCDEWKRLNPMGARDAFLFAAKAHLLRGEVSQAEHNLKNYTAMGGDPAGGEETTKLLHKLQGYREYCLQELGKRSTANNKTNVKFARKMCEICPMSPQLYILKAAICLTAQEGGDYQQDVAKAVSLTSEPDRITQIVRPTAQYARVLHRIGLTQEADMLLDEVCTRVSNAKTCQDLLQLFRAMESAKSDANEAYLQGKLDLAVEMNTKALQLDASNDLYNAVIYSNRAACYMQSGEYAKAVDDCDAALKLSPSFLRARLRRARSLLKMNKFRECIADFELALRASPSGSVATELAEARAAYKEYQERRFSGRAGSSSGTKSSAAPPPPPKVPKVDLYKVLGVTPQASNADIKKAYHRAALKHHPDKNIGDDTAAQRFKGVLEAFNTLKDPTMRKKYDMATNAIGVPMM